MCEYASDSGAGQANGEGIQSIGGTSYALSPSGNPLKESLGSSGYRGTYESGDVRRAIPASIAGHCRVGRAANPCLIARVLMARYGGFVSVGSDQPSCSNSRKISEYLQPFRRRCKTFAVIASVSSNMDGSY